MEPDHITWRVTQAWDSLQLTQNLSTKAGVTAVLRLHNILFLFKCSSSVNGMHAPHRKDSFAPMRHTPSSSQTTNLSHGNFPKNSPNHHHRSTHMILGTRVHLNHLVCLQWGQTATLNSTVSQRGRHLTVTRVSTGWATVAHQQLGTMHQGWRWLME